MAPPPRIARLSRGRPLQPRVREGNSADHLAFVRRLPCCLCPHPNRPAGEAHHLLRLQGRGARGMGLRSADRWAVPLCRTHHHALHQHGGEEDYFAQHGVDARALANRLWHVTGDTDQGERAVARARQPGAL